MGPKMPKFAGGSRSDHVDHIRDASEIFICRFQSYCQDRQAWFKLQDQLSSYTSSETQQSFNASSEKVVSDDYWRREIAESLKAEMAQIESKHKSPRKRFVFLYKDFEALLIEFLTLFEIPIPSAIDPWDWDDEPRRGFHLQLIDALDQSDGHPLREHLYKPLHESLDKWRLERNRAKDEDEPFYPFQSGLTVFKRPEMLMKAVRDLTNAICNMNFEESEPEEKGSRETGFGETNSDKSTSKQSAYEQPSSESTVTNSTESTVAELQNEKVESNKIDVNPGLNLEARNKVRHFMLYGRNEIDKADGQN